MFASFINIYLFGFITLDNILEFFVSDEKENDININIFGNKYYEKIEAFIEKAFDESQKEKKNITRNTLSNMSTLKAKDDSFCKDDETIELEQEIYRILQKGSMPCIPSAL